MPDCSGWVTESHTTALGSPEKKEVLRSPPCPSFPVSVFLSFVPSISRCFALARCHTFFFSQTDGAAGKCGQRSQLCSSHYSLSLSLPFSCSLPHLHGQDEDVDRAAGLQLAAGQCRLSLRGGETQRETHRNSPVTNYFISTNIPCSLLINMRSKKLHVE